MLSCGKAIQFGICQVNRLHKQEFSLTNAGPFPFSFEFELTTKAHEEPAIAFRTVVKGKSPSKAKTNSLIIGPFTLNPSSGTLQPNAVIPCSVEFISPMPGAFKSPVFLVIPETGAADFRFQLSANCFSPEIVTKGNDKIFPKLPLCFRQDLARKDITSFLEDERVLHFTALMVNQKESVTVVLFNEQPIDCPVDLTIKNRQTKGPLPFDVSDKSVTIPSNSSVETTISFCPQSCDSFAASFEAAIKQAPQVEPLRFGLEGIGSIPVIVLKTPLDKTKSGLLVNVGKTLLGYDKQRSVTLRNESPLKATVSVLVRNSVDIEIVGINMTKPFVVEGNQQFDLNIWHRPQKVRKGTLDFIVSTAENPKASIAFSCIGEGISEDLSFEGLVGEDCEMHFRDCVVGRSTSIVFTMKNVSDRVIRFVWNSSNDITFSPRVGHIRRRQKKEICSSFYSDKPVKYIGGKITCHITKIELVNESEEDWDDSMKVVSFVPRSQVDSSKRSAPDEKMVKVTSVTPEPPYRVAANVKPKDIPMKAVVVCDTIRCSIDQTELSFAPTMMFQNRVREFKITNSSQIRMEYQWTITKFESLRTNYATSWPCPFSIEPQSGFIEAAQTTIFRAIFAPMEVDDFVASFRCNVPYMNDGPGVSMTGLSRRPICHFNVKTSEYLTRRHPDYTYPVPEGVKVIELFSRALNLKNLKKVEIVNPTSTAYEARWALVADHAAGAVTCESASVLVSSGKKCLFTFYFQLTSAMIVESLWEFTIPVHNIKIPFLFVGRLSH
jgi:hydrocephalus-inducing protein